MNSCDEIRALVAFYLDDELRGGERDALEAHLSVCPACRDRVARERRFVDAVRCARPFYAAPEDIRARVEEILSDAPEPYLAPPRLRRRVTRLIGRATTATFSRAQGVRVLVAAVAVTAVMTGLWSLKQGGRGVMFAPPSEFALKAVETHLRHLRGQLPLEVATDSTQKVSEWFVGKVPFSFKPPKYQEESGQEKLYTLEGARLVGFKNDYAAYVAYKMQGRPISLVVTSESVALPHGGEEIFYKGLTFHFDAIDGLKVISWADRGLTYALVSDLEERGQQSCIVCHQGAEDRDFIESLKPR